MDDSLFEKLPRFSWAEIKDHIENQKPFEAITPMATAFIRIKKYVPCFGLAIHAGHRVREELLSKMAIDEREREYEEDTFVDEFISDYPMQMIALDSRYEYDLNRSSDQAVYLKPFQSWGKKVWRTPPTKEELAISYQKWDEFHELLDYMIGESIKQHGKTLVFDMHSYNFQRKSFFGKEKQLPLFNVATSEKDHKKYKKVIDLTLSELQTVEIPGHATTVKENEVFVKDGAVATSIESKFDQALVLPIEVKKVYMNEHTGEGNREMIELLDQFFSGFHKKIFEQFLAS